MHSAELLSRLRRQFGLGGVPHARMKLYIKLGLLCERSEIALAIVTACALEARDKRTPDHWFAASVVRRLEECGELPKKTPLSPDSLGSQLDKVRADMYKIGLAPEDN